MYTINSQKQQSKIGNLRKRRYIYKTSNAMIDLHLILYVPPFLVAGATVHPEYTFNNI